MREPFNLDRVLVSAVQTAATSREQLTDLQASLRSKDVPGYQRSDAISGYHHLLFALVLAHRPEAVPLEQAVGDGFRALAQLLLDDSVTDVAAELPAAVAACWP